MHVYTVIVILVSEIHVFLILLHTQCNQKCITPVIRHTIKKYSAFLVLCVSDVTDVVTRATNATVLWLRYVFKFSVRPAVNISNPEKVPCR